MRLITVSGPPSSGKTAVLMKVFPLLQERGQSVGVVKFDCLQSDDDRLFQEKGIPCIKGLSGELCPDHYFVSNIEQAVQWGQHRRLDWLFSESAGLCNRCAPHIRNVPAVCVIDQMSGVNTPKKIGPMLRFADIVVVTKADVVSQAEREVFALRVRMVNPRARVLHVNGLTGQGAYELVQLLNETPQDVAINQQRLRCPMPMALCSYCLGEQRIGEQYQKGNVKKMHIPEVEEHGLTKTESMGE